MDFFEKGHACVELMDPTLGEHVWIDVDKDEIRRFLAEDSDKPWRPLTFPRTPSFARFVHEIDENMYRCWERYGKKSVTPKIVQQHLNLLVQTRSNNESPGHNNYIWVLVPLVGLTPEQGLTLMEASHRKPGSAIVKPYRPTVAPGSALMFDNRIRTRDPLEGGGVVFARAYDMKGL